MKRTLSLYLPKEPVPAFSPGPIGFTFVLLTRRILQPTERFVNKGIPVGLQSRAGQGGKSREFDRAIGVLPVDSPLTNAGISLSERGVVILEAGRGPANEVFIFPGICLRVKAADESPVLLLVRLQRGIGRLRPKGKEEGGTRR